MCQVSHNETESPTGARRPDSVRDLKQPEQQGNFFCISFHCDGILTVVFIVVHSSYNCYCQSVCSLSVKISDHVPFHF
jgi:hypothetical protein